MTLSWRTTMRILLTSLLSSFLLGAAAPPPLTDAELGKRLAPAVPPEGLTDTVVGEEGKKADAWLAEWAQAGFSGVVLAARDGKLVLAKGYGMADREGGTPFRVDSVFSIGSVTKQFTAAAILRLEQDGKLSAQDPITKFYPDAPADKRAITLHQLLTHTAGLDSDFAGDYDPVDRDAYVGRIFASKLRSAPGTTHHYANAGYSLLAAVVEKASGMPYETYLREKLFLPAGMKETGYRQPAWPAPRVAVGYRGKDRWGTILEKTWLPDGPGWALRGNGGIHTTLADMVRWERVLEGDGNLLSAASRRKMFTAWVPEQPGGESFYGYGWATFASPRGGRLIAHDGGNGIFSFDFRRYVDDGLLVLTFSNASDSKAFRLTEDVARLALGLTPRPTREEVAGKADPIDWAAPGMARVKGFVEAYNSGDVPTMRAFREANWQRTLETPPEDERDRRYQAMRGDTGKVTPVGQLAYSATEVTLLVKTERGELARASFGFSGEEKKLAYLRLE
ncbi:MAG TPA: serine hydrolase domain-containing protein [Candidatus Polarisedimenticolaceae bacterium]|nr:serine hydrolase domain-containing protein [Candidatus Polarisedimenticolaceae bacterium]